MRRFMRMPHRGEKGFTLLELLIVVVILGILAGVLVPRLIAFLTTGEVAKANDEVAKVESAALAYYADSNGDWPVDTNTIDAANPGTSLMDGPANTQYLDKAATYNYLFGAGSDGKVQVPDDTVWPGDASVKWDLATHKWMKQ